MTTRAIVFATALSLIATADLVAQGNSQGRGRGHAKEVTSSTSTSASVTVVFRDSDRVTFHDYFVAHSITAQPLPPGIAKNVARGKPLPPGIAKRAVPAELIAVGPRVEQGVSFSIVGNVVVATKSGVVIDVLAGVFK